MPSSEPQPRARVSVAADPADDAALVERAITLADELGLPHGSGDTDMQLTVTPQRLELRVLRGDASLRGGRPVAVDLLRVDVTSPRGRSLKQPLARALGLPRRKPDAGPLHVFDATAGMGEDTWLMAALGCTVHAVERNPVVFALLRDGLRRAAAASPDIAARITLSHGDARRMLRELAEHPDVVYLDPMFESGRKTIGPKTMRVLRALVGDDVDSAELFSAAAAAATVRVVVKRPIHAPPIAPQPAVTFTGKSLRYDMYPSATLTRR